MKTARARSLSAVVAAALAGTPQGLAQPRDQKPGPTFGVEAAAVLLDVVVKDKKGRPVRDLQGADFEVFEDGVRQDVRSFQVVARETAAAPVEVWTTALPGAPAAAPPAAAPASGPGVGPGLLAFVFDRLSPQARVIAQKAAVAYLDSGLPADHLVAVYAIDLKLLTLQNYTTSRSLIRTALQDAASTAIARHQSNREQVRELMRQHEALDDAIAAASTPPAGGGPAGGEAAAAAGAAAGIADVQRMFNEMNTRMLQTFEALEREQQGFATTNALLSVVNAMSSRPGRKTVVFFSEGLALPPAVLAQFRSVIHAANRANVSVYAMDAAGLRSESTTVETRREVEAAMRSRTRQVLSGRDDGGIMLKGLERNEDLLRLDPHSGLGQLAEETGGLLIRDTNDLAAGFRRLDEDMRFHYVLAYYPANATWDGKFRRIEVKVRRPDLSVHSRKGYFAVRSVGPLPVLVHEVPALALLDRKPRPDAFPLHVQGLSFPEPGRPGLVPVLAEVPGSVLTYQPDEQTKTFRTDFTILALIRDASGNVVAKVSQHYPLTGPLSAMENVRRGAILFYREAQLPPGTYTVETVAYDALSQAASTRTATVHVPAAEEGRLHLSSVVVVKRVERVPAAEVVAGHPLYFGEALLYPNLGEPVRKATAQELTFFFTAYLGRAASAAPRMTIEVLHQGQVVGRATLPLPRADASGRIQHVAALPLGGLAPGAYDLRITVHDDRAFETRIASFTIEG